MIKKQKMFFTKVRSRHDSHDVLRMNPLLKFPFKSGIRLGSTTEYSPEYKVLNSIDSVKISSNKLKMKEAFKELEIPTASWGIIKKENDKFIFIPKYIKEEDNELINSPIEDLKFPIVSKHIYGSRGTGNSLINSLEELNSFLVNKDLDKFIFERFYNYSKEYRLHVSKNGCFYTCRKMLKADTPQDKRWFRNDSNSVWILEENELFDKPLNWDIIVEECVDALDAVGLDLGAIDLKVQSSKNKEGDINENPLFIILETNSAPSFGEITTEKYIAEIKNLLKNE
jgi:glutathione synthase/RimK-type ligase-like ATP-grasp enzyme